MKTYFWKFYSEELNDPDIRVTTKKHTRFLSLLRQKGIKADITISAVKARICQVRQNKIDTNFRFK